MNRILAMSIFLGIFSVIFFGLNYYVIGRIAGLLGHRSIWITLAAAVLAAWMAAGPAGHQR